MDTCGRRKHVKMRAAHVGCSEHHKQSLSHLLTMQGGSTMFKNFGRKLKMDVQGLVNKRLGAESKGVPVNVFRHQSQDIAVWIGGSLLSKGPDFLAQCHTRADYEEYGPSVCWSHV
jgi:actin-related protein 3